MLCGFAENQFWEWNSESALSISGKIPKKKMH